MVTSVQIVEISILRYVPEMLAWIFGLVLAVIIVRRGGGWAEKLFLAGCCLMFVTRLATPLLSEFVQSLMSDSGMSNVAIARTMGWVNIPMSILAIAGLVCLVIAFWVRFKVRRQVAA